MKKFAAICVASLSLLYVGASSPNCQAGYFCVADYPTPQDAVTAAAAAGGGRVWFSQNALVSSAITIPDNIKVECSSPGIAIGTTSATADLFDIPGTNIALDGCTLNYAGSGTKTAGALVRSRGVAHAFDGIIFGGNCFVCMDLNGIEARVSNVLFSGNFAAPAAVGSGAILIHNEVTHLNNITLGATPAGNFYDFGIRVLSGAVDGSNLEVITAKIVLHIAPPAGKAAFWKTTTTYLDNCLNICALFQPTGGAIGYATLLETEFGAQPGGTPIVIDTGTYGGNIGKISVGYSEIFNYATFPEPSTPVPPISNNSVNLYGSLGVIDFSHNTIGERANGGFVINSGTNCRCIVSDNDMHGIGAGFWGGSVVSGLRMHDNFMNGSSINQGGNPSTSFYNNL